MEYPLQRRAMPDGGWTGWRGPLLVTALAAILRLPGLSRPHAVVFDETYYAKDALSLLRYGYERKTVEGANELLLSGQSGIFTADPEYVVHPPVGKWAIALGEQLFGATPFGWRIIVALLGIASVLVTARVARRLSRSNTVGTLAGALLALDGLHIAISRTALLDMTLSFLVLCAFAVLILDRDTLPSHGIRWTRPAMAVLLGLALGTKWSAVYYAVTFVVLMLWWDLRKRHTEPVASVDDGEHVVPAASGATATMTLVQRDLASAMLMPVMTWVKRDLAPAMLMPVIALGTYLATWIGWFRSPDAWDRTWLPHGQTSPTWFSPLRALWHYHAEMLSFHINLHVEHNYRANPWGWPLMLRPTSFFYESPSTCGSDSCSQEVIPLGNPVIWWFGALAVGLLAYFAVKRVHSAAAPIVAAFAAGWVPWLFFPQRTAFNFYSVVYVPYTAIALALMAYILTSHSVSDRDLWNPKLAALVVGVASLTVFFYPILTGMTLTYDQWHMRMWLPSWI